MWGKQLCVQCWKSQSGFISKYILYFYDNIEIWSMHRWLSFSYWSQLEESTCVILIILMIITYTALLVIGIILMFIIYLYLDNHLTSYFVSFPLLIQSRNDQCLKLAHMLSDMHFRNLKQKIVLMYRTEEAAKQLESTKLQSIAGWVVLYFFLLIPLVWERTMNLCNGTKTQEEIDLAMYTWWNRKFNVDEVLMIIWNLISSVWSKLMHSLAWLLCLIGMWRSLVSGKTWWGLPLGHMEPTSSRHAR